MSGTQITDPVKASPAGPKAKKNKKKKAGPKEKAPSGDEQVNGTNGAVDHHPEPIDAEPEAVNEKLQQNRLAESTSADLADSPTVNGRSSPAIEERVEQLHTHDGTADPTPPAPPRSRKSTGAQPSMSTPVPASNGAGEEPAVRLEAMARERTALRDEVVQLRQSLEELQGKHEEELQSIRGQLEDSREERDNAETQYRNLLGKVNTIKSQLGERLKADAEELAQARKEINELHEQNANLQTENDARAGDVANLAREGEERSRELSTLRNRLNLSQQNWNKERDDLIQQGTYAREEFESAKQAMSDWEILAMDERSIHVRLAEKVEELEEQMGGLREERTGLVEERDGQRVAIDGLQRALQEIQDARRTELREVVENSQVQIEELRRQVEERQTAAASAAKALADTQKELEKALSFEADAKEKGLLIGKLRHEAVILNSHLTKALKQLNRGKVEDTIDRQLVTNHFLHFISIDRSDPKKFQVLQIMASLLNWTDEQREQAGLARPGASNPNLRTPVSPWHRTPSTPSLSQADLVSSEARGRTESGWLDGSLIAAESARGSRSTSISSRQ